MGNELLIGDNLRQARLNKNISLDELQQKTKIQKRYLEAIEKGAFDVDLLVKENLMPLQKTLQELHILLNETKDLVTNLKDSPSDLLFKEETFSSIFDLTA